MTTKTKVFIGIGVVAVVGLGYYLYSNMKSSWRFTDNHWGADDNYKLGFIGTQKPPFKAGDKINIVQDAGAKIPEYSGATTVSSVKKVGEKWVVSIPKAYLDSTPVNGGVING